MPNNNDSILYSVKNALGIFPEDTSFDGEIVMHINAVLSNLVQMGVGPAEGFVISDENALWSQFISDPALYSKLQNVKTYVSLKVRLIFDPPVSSITKDAFESQCKELEYRMYTECGGY